MISMSRCAWVPKPCPGWTRSSFLVDHAQGAEPHVLRIVVLGERECVEGLEPAVLGKTPFLAAADFHHGEVPLQ
jgi:hypothetical protein